jgi:predicted ATPase
VDVSHRSAGGIENQLLVGSCTALAWHPSSGRLIGRESELTSVHEIVRDLAAGQGRSVWIDGEPGIGKTAFLAEALNCIHVPGCQIYAARTEDTVDFFPLRALLDALHIHPGVTDPHRAAIADRLWGRGTGDLILPGNAVTAAAEMLLVLVDRLCSAGPVVLAVDDIQWADDATVAVWGRLDAATQQLPLLLVAAARPVPRRDEVARLRRQLISNGCVNVELERLDEDQVDGLVRQIASAPPGPGLRGLVRQAGGNPLYVRELVDALLRANRIRLTGGVLELSDANTAAPTSLAAAISTRLSFFSDSTTRVLRTAAILGSEFRLEQLSLLVGQPPMALGGHR